MGWDTENIPDEDYTYRRINRVHVRTDDGTIRPGAFKPYGFGISVDWARYSTPQETRDRGGTPQDNAVGQLLSNAVRAIEDQTVNHSPLPANRAHSVIIGRNTEKIRVLLTRIVEVVIPL